MTIFAEKLATLVQTVRAGASGPIDVIAQTLRKGAGRSAVAIGSGGSAIMAEYFTRCRSTLGLGVTLVQTPMEAVIAQRDLDGTDVWIFSAGADNPDTAAALTAAIGSTAASITIMTVNAHGGSAVAAAADVRATTIVVPVADRKDGFLATHSLVGMATAVLAATNGVLSCVDPKKVVERLATEYERITSSTKDSALDFRPGDTVVVLHDPQCKTLATLIETSLWETAIVACPHGVIRLEC